MANWCQSTERHEGPWDPSFYAFTFPLLLPLSLGLCVYFLWKLYDSNIKKMVVVTAVFVSLALCFQLVGGWVLFLKPMLGIRYSASVCATLVFFHWMLLPATYVALQRVLLLRLRTVFDNSEWAVHRSHISLWTAFHSVILTVALVMFSFFASKATCNGQVQCEGFAVAIGFFPKHFVHCNAKPKYDRMAAFTVIFGGLSILGANAVLAWMYLSRIRKAFGSESDILARDSQINAVIRKSTVVAFASVMSTSLAIIFAGFGVALCYVDILLNVAFLFCQFKFGQLFYDATLFRCELLANCFTKPNISALHLTAAVSATLDAGSIDCAQETEI